MVGRHAWLEEACVAGGVHGWGTCVAGGVTCVARKGEGGCGHPRTVGKRAVRILLEC